VGLQSLDKVDDVAFGRQRDRASQRSVAEELMARPAEEPGTFEVNDLGLFAIDKHEDLISSRSYIDVAVSAGFGHFGP